MTTDYICYPRDPLPEDFDLGRAFKDLAAKMLKTEKSQEEMQGSRDLRAKLVHELGEAFQKNQCVLVIDKNTHKIIGYFEVHHVQGVFYRPSGLYVAEEKRGEGVGGLLWDVLYPDIIVPRQETGDAFFSTTTSDEGKAVRARQGSVITVFDRMRLSPKVMEKACGGCPFSKTGDKNIYRCKRDPFSKYHDPDFGKSCEFGGYKGIEEHLLPE